MKFLDYTLKLSSLAVETIEEHYDKSIDEILTGGKLRAKDVHFILWACIQEETTLEEAKKTFGQVTYSELIKICNGLFDENPNAERADDTAAK